MRSVLIKFTVDLYAPSAVIRPKEMEWFERWKGFHTRRIIYPTRPLHELANMEDNVWIASQDFCHIRVQTLDGNYCGVMYSEMDYAMAGATAEVLLSNQIHRIANTALFKAPPFNPINRTYVSWLELWDWDETVGETLRVTDVEFKDIVDIVEQLNRKKEATG